MSCVYDKYGETVQITISPDNTVVHINQTVLPLPEFCNMVCQVFGGGDQKRWHKSVPGSIEKTLTYLFNEIYTKVDGKWVKKEASNLAT